MQVGQFLLQFHVETAGARNVPGTASPSPVERQGIPGVETEEIHVIVLIVVFVVLFISATRYNHTTRKQGRWVCMWKQGSFLSLTKS